jgi:hypothetical protein
MEAGKKCLVGLCLFVILLHSGCAHVGSTAGTDQVVVQDGWALITYSPTLKAEVPVQVALGDEVAKAAANAAVGYLKGVGGAITQLHLDGAVQKGMEAGIKKSAESGKPVTDADRKELESFLRQVVEKI